MNNKLRDLFQQPFDLVTYRRVILGQLLHAQRLLTSPEMLEQYDNGDQMFGLGYLTDNEGKEIGLYYTHVPNGDVRRKRVGFRKMFHPYVKYGVDAAIAVFDDGEYWRLSYICDLKGGVTSAKRFSYVFGDPKGQYNTPVGRLTDLAKKRLTLDELHKTFSVDALSKEFFDEYHRHYDRIIAELSRQGNTGAVFHDYVKKMMGRIVFLHFLQKKRWLNDDPEFLSKLFFLSPYKQDFLDQELEPLFFGIFNTEPDKREQLFHQEHWDLRWLSEWEKLPYLNGGLFERDEVDKMKIKLPASLFEQLFEFMASYNFTVDENDPDDAEVGVDPEMLGKIFESLLEDNKAKGAFYTPKEIVRYMCKESLIAYLDSKLESAGTTEAASERLNARSANNPTQGTQCRNGEKITATSNASERLNAQSANNPTQGTQCGGNECESETRDLKTAIRAFVEHHEMQPELESYRDTLDAALRNVKICDPAIGSGAFPMGLLNELWRCREALMDAADTSERCDLSNTVQAKRSAVISTEKPLRAGGTRPQTRVELKKQIIENNIYGVDIERGAIDIARLRFWLSIVVDAEEPEPLPNFDYKFMQGNSLIESFEGHDLSHIMDKRPIGRGGRQAYQRKIDGKEEIQISMDFSSDDTRQNLRIWLKKYFSLTDHKEKAHYRELINGSVKSYIKQQGIGPTAEAKLDKLDPSANQDFFLWHTWFKDIFDNGGFDIVIGNPPYIQLQADGGKLGDLYKNCGFETFARTGDIYSLFYEQGWNILNKGGLLCLITSNKWMRAGYGESTRKFFATKTNPLILVDLGANVFENATVDTNILLLTKDRNRGNTQCATFSKDSKISLEQLNDFVLQQRTVCKFGSSDSWVILSPIELSIKRKIEALGTPLKDWDIQINYGIKTGCNDAFIITTEKRDEILANCQTEEERQRTAELIRPILRGRDIKKYSYKWAGLWLINTHNGVRGRIQRIDINDYPAIKQHLDEYWDVINSRADKGDTPYNLRNCAYLDEFDKPKLIFQEMVQESQFMYDDSAKYMCNDTCRIITGKDIKYLLAIMNSKLFFYAIKRYYGGGALGDNGVRMKHTFFQKFHCIQPNKAIINMVEKLIMLEDDKQKIEKEIDKIVYQLYNLTPDEIAIIEQ